MFAAALVVCISSAAIATVLHFQMKFRLLDAGLPVKWFMTLFDDMRMWRSYKAEAHGRGWPIWPFYAYRVLLVLFGLSGLVLLHQRDTLFAWLAGR